MSLYPRQIDERFKHPRNAGRIDDPSCGGRGAALECGCAVGISLRIDAEGKIEAGGFWSNGCGYMIAAADSVVSLMLGKRPADLGFLRTENAAKAAAAEIGCEFPADRRHCIDAGLAAAKAALEDHRQTVVNEFKGEAALICTCFGIDEETITGLAASESGITLDDVAKRTNAGSGCGSCRMLIQEILDNAV
ncbi:MAG: iron-sulfur cluster assembly scaffold protein [Acidobacteria bacterium]|nr:iron-sulfur cluster assembly scaffold protein [Acidobacteriota bacterium]